MHRVIEIICTRTVDETFRRSWKEHHFQLQVCPMISVAPIKFHLDIKVLPPIWIFTSVNAVKSLLNHPNYQTPDSNEVQIAAIGHKTANALREADLTPKITGSNATELAKAIIESTTPQSVVYFTGSRRREELPILLAENGFEVKETIVYETQLTPSLVNWDKAEGAIFFSPSAVESFLMSNEWPSGKQAISIGPTTSAYLRQRNIHPVATASQPSPDHLLQTARQIFHSKIIKK